MACLLSILANKALQQIRKLDRISLAQLYLMTQQNLIYLTTLLCQKPQNKMLFQNQENNLLHILKELDQRIPKNRHPPLLTTSKAVEKMKKKRMICYITHQHIRRYRSKLKTKIKKRRQNLKIPIQQRVIKVKKNTKWKVLLLKKRSQRSIPFSHQLKMEMKWGRHSMARKSAQIIYKLEK